MFMHGSFFHLLFNMFGLWMFGSLLEQHWGTKRFTWFYLLCGIGAGVAQLLYLYFQQIDMMQVIDSSAVGASGAVFGILGAFAYLFPNTELYLYFMFPIKMKYAIALYAAYEIYTGIKQSAGDNVAHFAHLGGALFGFIAVSGIKKQIDPLSWLSLKITKLFKPKERLKVVHSRKSGTATNEPDQEEIDKILDKLAKVGYARYAVNGTTLASDESNADAYKVLLYRK
jgi:hypothetical protein